MPSTEKMLLLFALLAMGYGLYEIDNPWLIVAVGIFMYIQARPKPTTSGEE